MHGEDGWMGGSVGLTVAGPVGEEEEEEGGGGGRSSSIF